MPALRISIQLAPAGTEKAPVVSVVVVVNVPAVTDPPPPPPPLAPPGMLTIMANILTDYVI
jgi:hypothetical protein